MKYLILTLFINLVFTDLRRPVIGILTMPSDEGEYPSSKFSYFPASYVKQMEASGSMVIPISWEATYKELNHTLHQLDGILLPGGNTEIDLSKSSPGYTFNKFTDTAAYIFLQTIAHNKAGHILPIMGTCQGL
jgi:gamma-glutamyl hydrolase